MCCCFHRNVFRDRELNPSRLNSSIASLLGLCIYCCFHRIRVRILTSSEL
jgi:hypothetical protein